MGSYSPFSSKLQLEGSRVRSTNLDLKSQSELNTNLSLKTDPLYSRLSQSEIVDSDQTSKNITTIFKEIDKEKNVLKLEKQIDSQIKSSQRKVRGSSANFSQAREIIKGEESPKPRRKKREAPAASFDLKHRKALKTYLLEFLTLENKSDHLSSQLSKIETEGVGSSASKGVVKEILDALTEIGWETEPYHIFKQNPQLKTSSKGKRQTSDPKDLGWGPWDTKNPYRHLFKDREEWLVYINKISHADKRLEKYLSDGGRRFAGLMSLWMGAETMNKLVFSELPKLRNSVQEANSEFVKEIGKRILQKMKLVKKS